MKRNTMTNFFDLIPPEIHQFIASSLLSSIEFKYCRGKEYLLNEISLRTILNYARQGQEHHNAVMDALKFTVAPWGCHGVTTDLILHFAQDLREIDTVHTDVHFTMSSGDIPKMPNLRKAAVWASLPELHLIGNSPYLRNLSVIFLPDMDSDREDNVEWDYLVSLVSSLHLQSLDLHFKYQSVRSLDKLSVVDVMKFKDACTTVEHLSLRGCLAMTNTLSLMISELTNLKKLSLEVELHDSNVSDLEKIPELEIYSGFENSFAVVRKLANRVTTLTGDVESRSQIEALVSFPCLKELHIHASEELNYVIGDIVGNLEVLSICFPMCGLLLQGPIYPFYENISIADLCFIMQRARKLSILSIDQVKISSEDIEDIFKIVGLQLKQFCVCVNWQEEAALTRVAKILRAVARYCPNLEVLRFLQNSFAIIPPFVLDKEEIRNCVNALEMVMKNCDRFSCYERILSITQNGFGQ